MEKELELIKLLNFYTELYDKGESPISDKEWDNMYFELQELEKELGRSLPDSPTQKIHYEVVGKLKKVEHLSPMLSLAKTKDWNEFLNYFDSHKDVIGMLKMDGLTCRLTYEDGVLIGAETRGDGYIGEDILHNAKVIPTIPKKVNYKETLIVDGEIICKYDDFKEFEDEYANPRNFASGSIRLLDSEECSERKLTFIAWNVIKGLTNSLSDNLLKLRHMGFKEVPNTSSFDWDAKEWLQDKAKELNYPIDGLVGRYDDREYGESLGATGHHSKSAYAFKFYDTEFDTKLLDIEWQPGRSGNFTPVAIFEPVDDGISVFSRASLHNISIMYDIMNGKAYVGKPITVRKANEIIPEVVSSQTSIPRGVKLIGIPDTCPICGKPLEIRESSSKVKNLYCTNNECPSMFINQLIHFCDKTGLDIKGLSEKTLQKLIDWEWVLSFEDIFELGAHRQEWIEKDGFGPKSVDNILESIQSSCFTSLEKFIAAIGIPLIGKENAKILAKETKTWNNFRHLINTKFSFEDLETFGPEKAQSLLNFNYAQADIIVDRYMTFEENKTDNKNILENLTFVITGSLNNYTNRDELKQQIESLGGKVTGSVTKNTSYLINNDINSTTGKNKRAKELNIPILTEQEFIDKFIKI